MLTAFFFQIYLHHTGVHHFMKVPIVAKSTDAWLGCRFDNLGLASFFLQLDTIAYHLSLRF